MDNNRDINSQEKEIDLLDLGSKLWAKRKFVIKISLIGLIIGILIAFSIPREYTTTVILAPESVGTSTGNMGALAAMAGINMSNSPANNDLSSDVYPSIIESTPFLLGLSKIKVSDENGNIHETLFDYINDDQKKAWWSYIMGFPGQLLGVFSPQKELESTKNKNKNKLSNTELRVVNDISKRLNFSIDKKTEVITLSSTMQDPYISAFVADTLTSYLQSYIISYRTEKARADLFFTEGLYGEAKIEYEKVQQKYANYLDKNQNVILASYRVNQEELQNEVSLAYQVYNQMAQQLQLAKVKVQDQTPVYTIIQPAIVPIKPSKPNKKLIVVGFVFLFAFGACGYILGKEYLSNLKS